MTNTEEVETETEKEDEKFEILPAVKNLTLPLGIRCMEVNVQEVDEAVRQFSKKGTNITSPSWKFPHVSLEKLDVTHVMNAFRAHQDLPDNQLYMELMELLIDRLYYAIMTSFEFVNGLEAVFVNAGFELDPGSKKRFSPKQFNWDPLEIAKKSSEDNTPRPFHTANIGMLVRQFCFKMMGLENIVLNNLHSVKRVEAKVGLNDHSERGEDNNPPKKRLLSSRDRESYLLLRHAETQTEISLLDGCNSCFIAQNILKYVADKVDSTLRTLNEADSRISKTRLELKKDALSITQCGALLRWLQALEIDCDNIMNCANMLLDINVKYQDDIRALKEDMEIKEENFEKKVARNVQSMANLREEFRKEQETRSKISKLKDAAIIKSSDLEKQLQIKIKECEKLSQEREALQKSFNIAEELNLQIKNNLVRSSTELEKYKKDLEQESSQRAVLASQVRTLSEELARAGQEVIRLNESTELARQLQAENEELSDEVDRLTEEVEKHEAQEKNVKRLIQEKDSSIVYLEEELRKAYSKIELLTLYPDLNGPINTPSKATGISCIETMEMQVKSNQIRMEILRAQSERLTNTVTKLRQHMKSKSKTDLKAHHHQQQQPSQKSSRQSLGSNMSS